MSFETILEGINVNAQSSVRLTYIDSVLYVDPFKLTQKTADADYIFITHDHYDHFSPESIENIRKDTTVIVAPASMKDDKKLHAFGNEIVFVKPGETKALPLVSFETVASYNKMKPFHPKRAGFVGYVFVLDGVRVYVAGDTDATSEAKAVCCDVALVPIGGTYTMNPKEAAALVNEIRPAVAIPTHFGSIVGKPADAKAFREKVDFGIRVIEKLSF